LKSIDDLANEFEELIEEEDCTDIIHSNLAFPLLKKLTEVGDPMPKRVFKEEIARRYKEGNITVRTYLEKEGYLNYLNKDELAIL